MKTIKLFRDIILKDGTRYPAGTRAVVRPSVPSDFPDRPELAALPDYEWRPRTARLCVVTIEGRTFKTAWQNVIKQPGEKTLEKASYDGFCRSIGGKKVEPDGWDEHGFPSWLLALGYL
jgi:hypothetical protein